MLGKSVQAQGQSVVKLTLEGRPQACLLLQIRATEVRSSDRALRQDCTVLELEWRQ